MNFSLSVFHAMVQSGVNARCVSPASVVDFLKTFSSQDSICRIGPIPVDVSETPFGNDVGVTLVLAYCKEQEGFCTHLSGLPLLLTQDNILRVFDLEDPKFLSGYYDILPHCQEMFVHERLRKDIFPGKASPDALVFNHLMSKLFPETCPKHCDLCTMVETSTSDGRQIARQSHPATGFSEFGVSFRKSWMRLKTIQSQAAF